MSYKFNPFTGNLDLISTAADDVYYIVKNDSGTTINKGEAVYVSGAHGNNVLVKKAKADAELTSSQTLGLAQTNIPINGIGKVIGTGRITNLDTTAANNEGDPVYLSGTTAGGLIYGLANKPSAPIHLVYIGTVTRINANNGEIFVRISNGWELDELHDVAALTPNNDDVLTYESSTQLWKPKQGTAGPQGPQGDIGVQGATGPQGSQGDIGAQGVQGNIGPQGNQGAQGQIGNQGVQGFQGNQGNQGLKGFQGFQGNQGLRGFQGFQGNQGVQGSVGAQGNQGNVGAQGNQGFQGDTGSQGPQGTQGNTGPQGNTGAQGPQGNDGTQGPQGTQGNQGVQGQTGSQGPQGNQGNQGTPADATLAIQNQTTLQTNANFNIQSASASSIGGIIRGATSQTANLQEWQNSAGTALASINSSGTLTVPASLILGINNTQRIQTANTFSNGFRIDKRGTTGDSTAAITSNTEIGYHQFYGWNGSAYGRAAYVLVRAAQNFSVGNHGSIYSIFTTNTGGSADSTEKVRIGTLGTTFGNTTATHTITLPSTATGITLYNTADQSTNFERVRHYWSGNTYIIRSETGGSGTTRDISIGNSIAALRVNYAGTDKTLFTTASGATGIVGTRFFHTATNSSDFATGLSITPTINQSGTAGYTGLKINATETATGSGAKNLIDAQVGGTSRFTVNNAGTTTWADAANFVVGSTTGTKIGTATSQKIGFWNATPIVQPTTAVAEAVYVENSGGVNVNDDSTFDGYTLRQVVKALRDTGLLA